jgi:quercetin dioxygenase-like cupin family protein
MTSKRSISISTITGLALLLTVVAAAHATPPSGQIPSVPVIGTLDVGDLVNTDRIKFQAKDQVDVATYTVTYAGGGFSGWHTHPGIVFVTVQSGSVIRTVGCQSVTYTSGQSFIESDEEAAGAVANASATDPAFLLVTQIVPHGSVRRVDVAAADAPVCH